MEFIPLLIIVLLILIPFLAIYTVLKLWIKHIEKMSDELRENMDLKKENAVLEGEANKYNKLKGKILTMPKEIIEKYDL